MSWDVSCGLTALSVTVPAVAVAVVFVNMKPESAMGMSITWPPPEADGVDVPPPDEPPPHPEAIRAIGIASMTMNLAALIFGVLPWCCRGPSPGPVHNTGIRKHSVWAGARPELVW